LSKDNFLGHLIVVQLFYEVAGKDGNANVTVVIGVTLMELILCVLMYIFIYCIKVDVTLLFFFIVIDKK